MVEFIGGKTIHSRVVWFCALIVLLAGVASPAEAAKILRRGNLYEPYSLDPHRIIGLNEFSIVGDMLLGLYTNAADGKPILGAAESAETSADGLTWTFKIRNHTWSDGTAVTADDFVFAFRRILDPKTAAEYASVLYPIKNALKVAKGELAVAELGVRAPAPDRLIIELENPAPYLPELLMHHIAFPVPRHLVERLGNDWTKAGTMVSSGPYVLSEWRPHDHVRLVKNARFYDAANVRIDEIYFYPIEDDLAALKRYRAGELDTNERWPLNMHDWLAKNIPNEARTSTALWSQYMSFNSKRKPFGDIRVRKALAMAIDRKAIMAEVFQGLYGDEAFSVLPPGTANVDLSAKVEWAGKSMDERRSEAKRLLAAAGFGASNPLHFTYSFPTNNDNRRMAVAMQAMWKQIGVSVDLLTTEAKVHTKLLQAHDFDVAHEGWNLDYNDAKNQLYLFQSTTVEMNYVSYNSPAFDALLRQADREADVDVRAKILGQAEATLLADLPVAPAQYPYQRQLVKSYVLNWITNPTRVNLARWLDISDKPGPGTAATGTDGGTQASEDGFWSWLASWFSWEAWQKWWNASL